MHLRHQSQVAVKPSDHQQEGAWNQANRNVADEEVDRPESRRWARDAHARQVLSTRQISTPQKEEVVELSLLAPCGLSFVLAKLVIV